MALRLPILSRQKLHTPGNLITLPKEFYQPNSVTRAHLLRQLRLYAARLPQRTAPQALVVLCITRCGGSSNLNSPRSINKPTGDTGIMLLGQFLRSGHLSNTQDTNYRPIDDDFPVFGFAVDIGKVSTSSVSTLFQLSLHQENCVQFEGANGNQTAPCLWTSYFSDETSAVSCSK
jgi:hypothetical protein